MKKGGIIALFLLIAFSLFLIGCANKDITGNPVGTSNLQKTGSIIVNPSTASDVYVGSARKCINTVSCSIPDKFTAGSTVSLTFKPSSNMYEPDFTQNVNVAAGTNIIKANIPLKQLFTSKVKTYAMVTDPKTKKQTRVAVSADVKVYKTSTNEWVTQGSTASGQAVLYPLSTGTGYTLKITPSGSDAKKYNAVAASLYLKAADLRGAKDYLIEVKLG